MRPLYLPPVEVDYKPTTVRYDQAYEQPVIELHIPSFLEQIFGRKVDDQSRSTLPPKTKSDDNMGPLFWLRNPQKDVYYANQRPTLP